MIVDTSAVIAIINNEPDAAELLAALQTDSERQMSAATYAELAAVVEQARDPVASRLLDDFLERAGIAIMPVTAQQARIARRSYWDYGKRSGHKAGLNFGDCFSYALALLFKGADFPTPTSGRPVPEAAVFVRGSGDEGRPRSWTPPSAFPGSPGLGANPRFQNRVTPALIPSSQPVVADPRARLRYRRCVGATAGACGPMVWEGCVARAGVIGPVPREEVAWSC
ncbi:type II toxin-antitoxin system VapC family toxin [Lipingzhangella sp. LS1_29]|uniref:Ribonuclease VapC n=1 Tax=Lipingzhangella rawalii TaxID=2055835 RepID=A0ABU2H153_9ACTN|nr:type II toxin-antitoxin system VapC family toxin [Lipingzhangella rawalii]MDS1269028.1 type II toxin-antitoxin system VapC family toxin [Lipingzhangella rawalii]